MKNDFAVGFAAMTEMSAKKEQFSNSGFIQLLTLRPLPWFASATKLSHPQPIFQQQKSEKISEPRGRRLFETMKSQKSSHAVPSANGWKCSTL